MQIPQITLLIIALISSIFSIATSAIGIQSMNQEANKTYLNKHKVNHNFLIFNLVIAIIVVFISGAGIAYKVKSRI
jgi:hypothetical protein